LELGITGLSKTAQGPNDTSFMSSLIEELESHYKIDRKRIFAEGSSNGATFCHALAARLSDKIAAIGTVSGSLPEAGASGRFSQI